MERFLLPLSFRKQKEKGGAAMMTHTTVERIFMGSDGTVWHARCEQPLEYHGTRGGLLVDFFCPDCQEHLSLPLRRLPSLDMNRPAPGGWAPRFALSHAD
jgi:hypothetical protein